MKKFRIAAIIMALFMVLASLAACGEKLNVETVNADPMTYINEGMKLTLDGTPFAKLVDPSDKAAFDIKIDSEETKIDLSLALDAAAMKGAMELEYEAPESYEFDEETGEETPVGSAKNSFAAYYADKQLAIKTDLLKDYLGTDSVGVDFGMTKEELKETELYKALVNILGITEEDFSELETAVDFEAVKKAINGYIDDIKKISTEEFTVGEATEETLVIGETEVKTIVVPLTYNEKTMDNIVGETMQMLTDIIGAVKEEYLEGSEMTEDDIKEALKEATELMPEMKQTVKYYLSAKTGALVKITTENETKSEDELGETVVTKTNFEIVFGADPTAAFLPTFTATNNSNGNKLTVDGKSSVVDGKFVLEGNLAYDEKEEDEGDGSLTYKFELGTDGAYTLTLTNTSKDAEKDDVVVITGTLKATDNGIEFSADLRKAYDEEIAGDDITDIKLTVTLGQDVPAMPEYKNIFDFKEEDLGFLEDMMGMGGNAEYSYAEDCYYNVMYYAETDEATLDAYLSKYAENGFASEEDYLFATYANYVYADLVANFGVAESQLDAIVQNVANEGGTYEDIALALDDVYYQMMDTIE